MDQLDSGNEYNGIHIFPYSGGSKDWNKDPEIPTSCSENYYFSGPNEFRFDNLSEILSPVRYVQIMCDFLPHGPIITTVISQPQEVSEYKEASKAKLVFKPEEVPKLVESSEAKLVFKPEEVPKLVESSEAELVSKPEEVSELVEASAAELVSKEVSEPPNSDLFILENLADKLGDSEPGEISELIRLVKLNWSTKSKGFLNKNQKSINAGRRRQQNPLRMITSVRTSKNFLKHWKSFKKGICLF